MTPNAEYVRNLGPGARFVWCDRPVTLQRAALVYTKHRGRQLFVTEDDGTAHRLHYYDDERVSLIDSSGTP
jgi:hypothetical protein